LGARNYRFNVNSERSRTSPKLSAANADARHGQGDGRLKTFSARALAGKSLKIGEGPFAEVDRNTFGKGECKMFLPAITGIHKGNFSISPIRRTQYVGGELC
jgi:hypothetical protein